MAVPGVLSMDKGGGGSNSDVWGRGKKRAADESSFTDLERFEKRLRRLTLREHENGRRQPNQLYTPINNHDEAVATAADGRGWRRRDHSHVNGGDEHMQLDDRPDRVYIHDLDAELASDSESDGEKLIFLPDIEKRFSRIPHQVLAGGSGDGSQELVLYSVPQSLSVDEEHDSVRKAIIEARARAREKAAEEEKARQETMERQYDQSSVVDPVESAHGYCNGYHDGDGEFGQVRANGWQPQYEDAMDID